MCIINYLASWPILLLGFELLSSNKGFTKMEPSAVHTITVAKSYYNDTSFFHRVYFSKTDAEKILGESAYLSDSSSTIKKDTLEIKRAYTALSKDQKTGKTGVIYFMIEKYNNESSAKNAYDFFKTANEKHQGVKTIHHMGDQAYFHSDGRNFYFILVRKGKIMFRIKVNKITSHTSLNEFNLVAKKISDGL